MQEIEKQTAFNTPKLIPWYENIEKCMTNKSTPRMTASEKYLHLSQMIGNILFSSLKQVRIC